MSPTTPLLRMFGRSPIRPLQKHMKQAHRAVEQLIPFFECVVNNDWQGAENWQEKICQAENDADERKKDIRLHLPKGLFLPVHRTDLLDLLSAQDRIANQAKDIAGMVLGRKMEIPSPITTEYTIFLKRCVDASAQACIAIGELGDLLETSFSGNEVKRVEKMLVELDDIERQTDEMQIKLRRSIFDIEDELPPVDTIFLYKVLEWTGDIADLAQNVGDRLQQLIAR